MRISDWSSDVCSSDLNRGLAFGGDEDISAKRCECSRESARDRVVAIGQQDRLSGKAAVGDGVGEVTGHPHTIQRFSRSQGETKTGFKTYSRSQSPPSITRFVPVLWRA